MSESEHCILVSGLHSGPNPSPGLGVIRSLAAVGITELHALDYSADSSGLYSDLVTSTTVFPAWPELDPDSWTREVDQLTERLGVTAYIPCLDLEVRMLAGRPHGPGLTPPDVGAVTKPPVRLAAELGLSHAPFIRSVNPPEIAAFIRRHGAPVWVKGQHYEAFRAESVSEVFGAGRFVEEMWGEHWHVEATLRGQECGIAFAAREGNVVDAVLMSKVQLTADGKTWAGQVDELPDDLRDRLVAFVGETGWTGGAEIELFRSWEGQLSVIEINPRFPAWIHGATVVGANLPAALVLGEAVRTQPLGGTFTRIIEEVPADRLSPYPWTPPGAISLATKHPSGMRALARRHLASRPATRTIGASRSPNAVHPLTGSLPVDDVGPTPRRHVDSELFTTRLSTLRAAVGPRALIGYSVKTNPDPSLMKEAIVECVPEVITQHELRAAMDVGFAASEAILNGPAKWWPDQGPVSCFAFFADSREELAAVRARQAERADIEARVVGVRLRTSRPSRFGIELDTSDDIAGLSQEITDAQRLHDAGWGVHAHVAQSAIGTAGWLGEQRRLLRLADRLAARLGPPRLIDVGGGWHPDDLTTFAESAAGLADEIASLFGSGTTLAVEPGKVLLEPVGAIVTTVLSAARRDAGSSVVVDACVAEVPEALYRHHPVAHLRDAGWHILGSGDGDVLGRSCMESDVLGSNLDLGAVRAGDLLAILDCGAYDTSMSYDFALGGTAQ